MIGMSINKAKSQFFDRGKVMNATSKATRSVLSKFGAGVRQKAQKSIQIREGASAPGTPPHGHKTGVKTRTSKSTGRVRKQLVSPLREFLFFVYEPSSKSVIIGPAKLSGKIGNAPEALEKGGPSEIVTLEKGKRVRKRVRIAKRAFMVPAFDREQMNLDRLWRNSIKP